MGCEYSGLTAFDHGYSIQNVQNMKVLTTTNLRKNIAEVISRVRYDNQVYGIGRHQKIEALIIKFPDHYNPNLNEITNFNANSSSFDFLFDEPDLYSLKDLKKRYA